MQRKTHIATLLSTICHEPFIFIFGLLPFILRKDLGATIFQIALLSALKPAVSIFSYYWSQNSLPLRTNFLLSGLLARIPLFLFPIFDSSWYLIFASAVYMLFSRASIPAWMEVLRLNLPKRERERLFSFSTVVGYLESILLALLMGSLLDNRLNLWKIFFVSTVFISLAGIFIQWKVPTPTYQYLPKKTDLLSPLKEGLKILKTRADFAHFQIGTMAAGFGAMVMMPALTLVYADKLLLSHSEMSIARYVFTGLGFVFLTPLWTKAMSRLSPNQLLAFICMGFGLFPLLILFSLYNHAWLYFAFTIYGITQSGSHLIWNLSGTVFAKDQSSLPFTSINVLMVGVRGLVAPFLSGILCQLWGAIPTLFVSIFISLLGAGYMLSKYPLRSLKVANIGDKT